MPPPTTTYSLSSLETEVNVLPNGRPRKPSLKLSDCALKELVQYKCNVRKPVKKGVQPEIVCEPVVRLIRMCETGLNIETTAWERWTAKQMGR
ncbi:hypothetical protein T440DRAFT_433945 [Plenodomus tracheiphilus IPT5]|uniref:Uncharacterized protein n=1 Tax=Plenodomus tracheiphilus IPT5 TaxID=1408161 RepID=A0A6A7AUU3_9PLEO|nr:hypothetical protein T440DRAFT_433945 [Plenodomus tracheiphilus IPT5]